MIKFTKTLAIGLAGLMATVAAAAPAAAQDHSLKIVNYSGQSISRLYYVRSSSYSDTLNAMGAYYIGSNQYMWWTINDGTGSCTYDFRFVMADGTWREKKNHNVCVYHQLNVID